MQPGLSALLAEFVEILMSASSLFQSFRSRDRPYAAPDLIHYFYKLPTLLSCPSTDSARNSLQSVRASLE